MAWQLSAMQRVAARFVPNDPEESSAARGLIERRAHHCIRDRSPADSTKVRWGLAFPQSRLDATTRQLVLTRQALCIDLVQDGAAVPGPLGYGRGRAGV